MPVSARIPDEEYRRIVEQIAIACIDLVIMRNGSFLLGRRTNDPAKDEWFPLGGRIRKGESLQDAAARKLKEEAGVEIPPASFRFLTAGETIFTGVGPDQNRHSVNVVYVVELSDTELTPDPNQLEELRWFTAVDSAWHPYVQQILLAAGFTLA